MIAYRDGIASPKLLRLQAVEKDLAAQLCAFCEAEGLTIFLVCGSALGAVRHGDVIPWDDDIDFGMLRCDFERLLDRLTATPLAGTWLQSHRNERIYPYPFAKLRREGTRVKEPGFVGGSGHDGIFIDIFPFDRLPRSTLLRALQRHALGLLNLLIMPLGPERLAASATPSQRRLRRIASLVRPLAPLRLLIGLRNWLSRLPGVAVSDEVDSFGMYGIAFGPVTRIDLATLVPPRPALLGTLQTWLPRDSDAYLTSLFGDYHDLPPLAQRIPGHVVKADFGDAPKRDPAIAET